MQLSYRGATYAQDLPTVEMTESAIGGQYRGQAWTYRYPRHIPVPQATPDLKYRGVDYSINSRFIKEEISEEVASSCRNRHQVLDRVEEIHLTNIRRRLEHRLQVAQKQGDRNLLRMLEAESKQLIGQC